MKKLVVLFGLMAMFSCNSGKISSDKIEGDWQIVAYEEGDDNPFKKNTGPFELMECDTKTIWHFTRDGAEILADGMEVTDLLVAAEEGCMFFEFQSQWALKGKKLFLSSMNLGGIEGRSYAGLFEIKELNDKKMVLEISDAVISFTKLK